MGTRVADRPGLLARRSTMLILGALAALMIGVGAVGFALSASSAGASPTLVDLNGNPVVFDPESTPAPASTPNSDSRFVVPSVGLDVPLASLEAVDGQITPPDFTSAYLVTNEGVSLDAASTGTVFVVMHSLRGGGVGPGNYLIDPDQAASKLDVGATVTVGGLDYTVSSAASVIKTDLPTQDAIWANVANRLVIITCLQRADGEASTNNMVIIATRTP